MLEAADDFGIRTMADLANKIYDSGYVLDMRMSEFVAIPKKVCTLECSKHRTISIVSQLGKIVLRVILARIRAKTHS